MNKSVFQIPITTQKAIKKFSEETTAELIADNFAGVENSNAEVIQSIDELSKSHAQSLERISDEIKKLNQMVQDGFLSDANYVKISGKIKELGKERAVIKKQIMQK